jgi:hypothetical protein
VTRYTALQLKITCTLSGKVSRVGELPDMDPIKDEENRILQHGYNSPFEEVALHIDAVFITPHINNHRRGLYCAKISCRPFEYLI